MKLSYAMDSANFVSDFTKYPRSMNKPHTPHAEMTLGISKHFLGQLGRLINRRPHTVTLRRFFVVINHSQTPWELRKSPTRRIWPNSIKTELNDRLSTIGIYKMHDHNQLNSRSAS
jgi:hypothetical protein